MDLSLDYWYKYENKIMYCLHIWNTKEIMGIKVYDSYSLHLEEFGRICQDKVVGNNRIEDKKKSLLRHTAF